MYRDTLIPSRGVVCRYYQAWDAKNLSQEKRVEASAMAEERSRNAVYFGLKLKEMRAAELTRGSRQAGSRPPDDLTVRSYQSAGSAYDSFPPVPPEAAQLFSSTQRTSEYDPTTPFYETNSYPVRPELPGQYHYISPELRDLQDQEAEERRAMRRRETASRLQLKEMQKQAAADTAQRTAQDKIRNSRGQSLANLKRNHSVHAADAGPAAPPPHQPLTNSYRSTESRSHSVVDQKVENPYSVARHLTPTPPGGEMPSGAGLLRAATTTTVKRKMSTAPGDKDQTKENYLTCMTEKTGDHLKLTIRKAVIHDKKEEHPDPFVQIRWQTQTLKTKVKKNTCNPLWGESFMLSMKNTDPSQIIYFNVIDKDLISKDDPLFDGKIRFRDIPEGKKEFFVGPHPPASVTASIASAAQAAPHPKNPRAHHHHNNFNSSRASAHSTASSPRNGRKPKPPTTSMSYRSEAETERAILKSAEGALHSKEGQRAHRHMFDTTEL